MKEMKYFVILMALGVPLLSHANKNNYSTVV